jgi:subtilisin family serine protease
VGRRFLVVVLLALVGAAGAQARVDADPLFPQEWWLSHIGATQATPPGPGIPLAIIDTGTDLTHPEFAGRPNTTFLNDQTTLDGDEWHGTFVASTAAAPDNGVGIDGIYPQAALELWDASPTAATEITPIVAVAGIDAIASRCPAVISISWGGTDPNPELEDALLRAMRNGCLIVAAAGNNADSGSPSTYPASYPHVLAVAATDENDAVARFSTVGSWVDLAAPGTDIIGAVPTWRRSTGFDTQSGTSFSAPIVAAAAAWIWTARPTLTTEQVSALLRATARDVPPTGFDGATGWGIVNIPAALAAPTPPNDPDEPNDDIRQVRPGMLFSLGEPPLTSPARPSTRIAGTLEQGDDTRDLYRIWVPAKKYAHVSTASGGNAAARIWGPKTVGVGEGLAARRRDLKGQRMYGGKTGSAAYVEVLLTGRSGTARYTLSVTASKK